MEKINNRNPTEKSWRWRRRKSRFSSIRLFQRQLFELDGRWGKKRYLMLFPLGLKVTTSVRHSIFFMNNILCNNLDNRCGKYIPTSVVTKFSQFTEINPWNIEVSVNTRTLCTHLNHTHSSSLWIWNFGISIKISSEIPAKSRRLPMPWN